MADATKIGRYADEIPNQFSPELSGHGDALCPLTGEAEKSSMGDHLLVEPLTINEFRMSSIAFIAAIHKSQETKVSLASSLADKFLQRAPAIESLTAEPTTTE